MLDWKAMAAVSFTILLILNLDCLANPPYWDDIFGIHNQAIWLSRHKFDLIQLFSPTEKYILGGSNVYLGFMPYLYGILYSIFAPQTVHILGHLFNIGCAALAFTLFYLIMKKFTSPGVSLLWCVAAVAQPVMAGAIASLGQEYLLAAVGGLAIYCLLEKRLWQALTWLIVAYFIKMTALVLALAFLVWIIADWILFRKDSKLIHYRKWVAAMAATVCGMAVIYSIWDSRNLTADSPQSFNLKATVEMIQFQAYALLPVFVLMLLVVLTIGMVAAIVYYRKILLHSGQRNMKQDTQILLLIFIAGFACAYFIYSAPLPRYTAFVIFPMCAFLAISLPGRISIAGALVFIALGLANINGTFFPKLPPMVSRSGEFLERSREYVSDIREQQVFCAALETEFRHAAIVAYWPLVQILTIPEMGYVTKPFENVYAAGRVPKYAPVRKFISVSAMPPQTMYVYCANTATMFDILPAKGDKIIWNSEKYPGCLMIYMKNPQKLRN